MNHPRHAALTRTVPFRHTGKTERQNLPLRGHPHPLDLRFFCARNPSGACPCTRFPCREGAEISPSWANTVRRRNAVLNLPTPHSLGQFQPRNRQEAPVPDSAPCSPSTVLSGCYPTPAMRQAVADLQLLTYHGNPTNLLDVLDALLSRASSMASVMGSAAYAYDKGIASHEDLMEVAAAVRDEIETALLLVRDGVNRKEANRQTDGMAA